MYYIDRNILIKGASKMNFKNQQKELRLYIVLLCVEGPGIDPKF